MIKAVVTKRVALTADVGSVVYISEGQFAALQGKVEPYKEEAKAVEEVKEDIKEEPIQEPEKPAAKKTSKGKKG